MSLATLNHSVKRRRFFFAACAVGTALAALAGCNTSPSSSNTASEERNSEVEIARSTDLEPPQVEETQGVREPAPQENSVYGPDEPEVPQLTRSKRDPAEMVDESEEDEAVLMERLQKLAQDAAARQQSAVPRSQLPKFRKMHRDRLAVADKVLNLAKPSEEAVQTAYTVKLDAYDNLLALEDENAGEEFRTLCAELVNHSDPQLSRVGRIMTLQFLSQDWQQSQSKNGKPLVDAVQEVLAHTELEPQLIKVCADIAFLLSTADLSEEAATVYESIAAAAGKSNDPQLKVEADAAIVQAKLMREEVFKAVAEYAVAEQPRIDDITARLDKAVEGVEANAGSFSVFSNLAAKWEADGLLRPAEQMYIRIATLFEGVDDKVLAPRVKSTLETARKRLGMIGQQVAIEGKTIDGQEFDWSAYRGKVVLVDFWATWCGPCREEMGNISQVYEKYQSEGFEVVGINLDEDKDALAQFNEQTKLAWANVVSDKTAEQGFNNPLAIRCGVRYIPFVMLIDRAGNVAAIHTRGERLEPAVKELLAESAQDAGNRVSAAPVDTGVLPIDEESTPLVEGEPAESEPATTESASDEDPKSNPLRTGRKPTPPAPLRGSR